MKTGGAGVNIWGLWQINETIVDKKLPIKKTVMGHNSVTIYWEICVIPENMVHKNRWKWVPAKKTIMLASLNQLIFTWKKECCIHSDQYFPLRFPYIPNNPTHWTNGIYLTHGFGLDLEEGSLLTLRSCSAAESALLFLFKAPSGASGRVELGGGGGGDCCCHPINS